MVNYLPARNHGSCIHQNTDSVQDDRYNYHDSLRACPKEEIDHVRRLQYSTVIRILVKFSEVNIKDYKIMD